MTPRTNDPTRRTQNPEDCQHQISEVQKERHTAEIDLSLGTIDLKCDVLALQSWSDNPSNMYESLAVAHYVLHLVAMRRLGGRLSQPKGSQKIVVKCLLG